MGSRTWAFQSAIHEVRTLPLSLPKTFDLPGSTIISLFLPGKSNVAVELIIYELKEGFFVGHI